MCTDEATENRPYLAWSHCEFLKGETKSHSGRLGQRLARCYRSTRVDSWRSWAPCAWLPGDGRVSAGSIPPGQACPPVLPGRTRGRTKNGRPQTG
eukprot:scaffold553660_cov42-Prasinocladus_malaysianus.AAC.1